MEPSPLKNRPYNLYQLLLILSRSVESELMNHLQQKGYQGLRMSFTGPMTAVAFQPMRMNELAQKLGISMQLCNQSLKPIEKAGLLERINDPEDKRAKIIRLTPKGHQLITDSAEKMLSIDQNLASRLQTDAIKSFNKVLLQVAKYFKLVDEPVNQLPTAGLIGLLSLHTEKELLQLTRSKGFEKQGFEDLQISFNQVLSNLSNDGSTTLSEIALLNKTSPQALSRTIKELEKLNYLEKVDSDSDKRSKQLVLTQRGQALMNEINNSTQSLNKKIIKLVGQSQLDFMLEQCQILSKAALPTQKISAKESISLLNSYIEDYLLGKEHTDTTLKHLISTDNLGNLDNLLNEIKTKTVPNNQNKQEAL